VGLLYVILTQKWLLPDRRPPINRSDDPREYSVEMMVMQNSPLVGQTVQQAGLRHLPGLFLIEIDRQGDVLAAVTSEERLQADDRLIFVGVIDSLVDLQRVRGLVPAVAPTFSLKESGTSRSLIEVVVSNRCPLRGSSIRDGQFRSVYNAAVIAVARDGRRIPGRLGDIVLETGDTLLLESRPSFVEELRDSPDFFLVSGVDDSAPFRHRLAPCAIGILVAMVLLASFHWLEDTRNWCWPPSI
jgi:Trk K+ transport system NAD-binding subunit